MKKIFGRTILNTSFFNKWFNFMHNTPSCLVGDTEMLLKLFCRGYFFRTSNDIYGIKPYRQWRGGFFKNSSCKWVYLTAAH